MGYFSVCLRQVLIVFCQKAQLGCIHTNPVYSTLIKLQIICKESLFQLGRCDCTIKLQCGQKSELWSTYKT